MAEHEVASVVWHEGDEQIYVTYVEEEADRMVATEHVATKFAEDAGLSVVDAPSGIKRWVRDPATPSAETDQEHPKDHETAR